MYIWLEKLTPVMTIIRMGRGLTMGVDHNKNGVRGSIGGILSGDVVPGAKRRRCGNWLRRGPRLAHGRPPAMGGYPDSA